VTPHGSKDCIEKNVREWIPHLELEARQGRFPPNWLAAYKEALALYKTGQEAPLNGLSVKNWPAASPAEVKILLYLNCLTVEDLAAANEELAQNIGMGARSLIQRAKDFLAAQKDTTPLVRKLDALAATVQGLEVQIGSLKDRNGSLEAENAYLRTQIGQAVAGGVPPMALPALEDRLASARANAARASVNEDALIDDAISET
jgi:cell division protein FtsB